MRRAVTAALAAMVLIGCGAMDRSCASVTGKATETCVGGVTYLQFTSGATVKVDRDGRPVGCTP